LITVARLRNEKESIKMFRTVKSMTIAGVLATSLPLLTGTANALTPNAWNLFFPYQCMSWSYVKSNGDVSTVLNITSYENYIASNFNVIDSQIIPMLVSACNIHFGLKVYDRPDQTYLSDFIVLPLHQPPANPPSLQVGWNFVRASYCVVSQPRDSNGTPIASTSVQVQTPSFVFSVQDSRDIDAILNACLNSYGFYGYFDGTNFVWNDFYYFPGQSF
jgi:hypothetical protein